MAKKYGMAKLIVHKTETPAEPEETARKTPKTVVSKVRVKHGY